MFHQCFTFFRVQNIKVGAAKNAINAILNVKLSTALFFFLQNVRKIKKAEQPKERKNPASSSLARSQTEHQNRKFFFNVNRMSICCLFVFNAFQPNYKRPQRDNMFFWFSVKQHNGKISEKNRRPLRYWQKSR